jgi:hypothetical protein
VKKLVPWVIIGIIVAAYNINEAREKDKAIACGVQGDMELSASSLIISLGQNKKSARTKVYRGGQEARCSEPTSQSILL